MSDSNSNQEQAEKIVSGCFAVVIGLAIIGVIFGSLGDDGQAEPPLSPPSLDTAILVTEEHVSVSEEETESDGQDDTETDVVAGIHPQYQSGNCNEQDLAFAMATSVQLGVDELVYIGETKRGRLSSSDEVMDDGTYFDIWVLYVCEATSVAIDMWSSTIDSYLLLTQWPNRNPDIVRQVADDDDSGEGNNARITRYLAPGVYGVVPSTFLPESGTYEVSVRAR